MLLTQNSLKKFYHEHKLLLATLLAFLLPLKLSLAYIVEIPLVLLYLNATWPNVLGSRDKIFTSLVLFVAATAVSALFGLNPLHSIGSLISLAFVIFTIPMSADVISSPKGYRVLWALVAAEAIAGLYAVMQSAYSGDLSRIFLGKVTESGQMGITLLVAAGILLLLARRSSVVPWKSLEGAIEVPRKEYLIGVFHFLLLVVLGFSKAFEIPRSIVPGLVFIVLAALSYAAYRAHQSSKRESLRRGFLLLVTQVILPLIAAGLLVNLKRGPWCGVMIGGGLLLFLYGRKFLFPAIVVGLLIVTMVEPIRLRLEHSSRDFFIYGGRNAIWQIGIELAPKYPLGIGFGNSSFLQNFSFQVPKELKHFHNNFLNILVETGWIPFLLFAYWLVIIMKRCFSFRFRQVPLVPAIGCGLLSWQVAGIVEYNVGDSEVMLVVYLLVGALIAITREKSSTTST